MPGVPGSFRSVADASLSPRLAVICPLRWGRGNGVSTIRGMQEGRGNSWNVPGGTGGSARVLWSLRPRRVLLFANGHRKSRRACGAQLSPGAAPTAHSTTVQRRTLRLELK